MQIGQIPVRTGRIPARKSLHATNGLPGCSGRESLDIHEKGVTTRSPRHGFGRRVRPSTWLCGVRVVFRSVVCLFVGVFLVRARDFCLMALPSAPNTNHSEGNKSQPGLLPQMACRSLRELESTCIFQKLLEQKTPQKHLYWPVRGKTQNSLSSGEIL